MESQRCQYLDQEPNGSNIELDGYFTIVSKASASPKSLFECTMLSPDITCPGFHCYANIRRTYFRHPHHMCYTFDPVQHVHPESNFNKCKAPWSWELILTASWNPTDILALSKSEKFPVIIHRTETCPPDKLSSVTAETGRSYDLSVTQQIINRLPPPYASKCTDYMKRGKYAVFGGYLTQDTCLQKCQMTLEVRKCGCVDAQHEFAEFFGASGCSAKQRSRCMEDLASNKTFQICEKKCRAPCKEASYDVRLTGIGTAPVPSYSKKAQKKRMVLRLKFSSDTQKILHYQPKLRIIEVFGYLGGYLGMWLGFSLFSFLKIIQEKLEDVLFGATPIKEVTSLIPVMRNPAGVTKPIVRRRMIS
ncbi:degenerin-like protein unc-105 [Ornithodoros turicata]|uniref:degenerin-like protein unc-105 n=1 Tax=Ornithodoros turicata TaxID=34597 RepID=UPI00313929BC